ncbi:glycosyltransferase [Rhizomicrobium electricum]|uniref:Spore protein YkvP/CgeB glycosyl transferase-like domain-containing protein n=1 Tax=Rhizomicrobium electricum TaxID=480070 RepID=A0ABN1E5Q2_9PROT|nr:glycosyltransferase [Rhizomicrobium electricum]NIJ47726.1 hypothetical protein [Rhizomicrobium electricum]
MKVILLKGQSKYDALRCYVDELARTFESRGDTVSIIDMKLPEVMQNFPRILESERPADLVFSFSILGEYADERGRWIGDIVGAPHVVLFVDFPFCHTARLEHLSPKAAILTIDASHVRIINSYFGPNRYAYVGFCPVAAMGEPVALPETAEAYLASRPVDVLCAMSYFAPGLPPWHDFPEPSKSVFAEAAELALSQEWMSAQDALDRWFIVRGIDFNHPSVKKELDVVRAQSVVINEWVRGTRRAKFFEAAAKVGLPLTCYGDGYADVLERYKNISYQGLGDTAGTPERMRQARLVINHNSNFGEGLHDRVPSGMLAGAAVATDTSKYYVEHYEPGREIALFRWQHLEEDLAKVKDLLADGDALFAMAKAGQQKALHQDRWEHRIDTILAAAHAVASR